MPRLKSVASGVVVSVSDATAALLGSGWVPADGKPAPSQATRSESPDESWSNKQIKAFASENQIDLGEAKNKAGFLAAIAAAGSEESDDEDSEESDESDDN